MTKPEHKPIRIAPDPHFKAKTLAIQNQMTLKSWIEHLIEKAWKEKK